MSLAASVTDVHTELQLTSVVLVSSSIGRQISLLIRVVPSHTPYSLSSDDVDLCLISSCGWLNLLFYKHDTTFDIRSCLLRVMQNDTVNQVTEF